MPILGDILEQILKRVKMKDINLANKIIGKNSRTFIVAELSANHNGDINRAKEIIKELAKTSTDAIKLQTYTPDTITLNSKNDEFMLKSGLWAGQSLYELYQKAYTPWSWQAELKDYANSLGLICFSSPFDLSSVEFLSSLDMPAYKIASFEINDIGLIRSCALSKKPIIISTGIATLSDIELAIKTCKDTGNDDIILLKCTSAYPSPYDDMNLRSIQSLEQIFDCVVGLSDHSLGSEVALGAVALGAKFVEKHVTLKRSDGGEDSKFSMEIAEFAQMVEQIRNLESALGAPKYDLTPAQCLARAYSRSLYICKDMKKGEIFSAQNLRSVRPNNGLHTQFYDEILGKKASKDIKFATPLSWDLVEF